MVDLPTVLPSEATPTGAGHDPLFPGERRRPGRTEHIDPELIPLFRSDEIAKIAVHGDGQDPLRAARGIVASLLLAAPFWVGIGGLLWRFW